MVAWVVGILTFATIVMNQQHAWESTPNPSKVSVPRLEAPSDDQPDVKVMRALVKVSSTFKKMGPQWTNALLGMGGELGDSPVEAFRHSVLVAEFRGAEEATKELDAVATALADQATPPKLSPEDVPRLQEEIASIRLILGHNADQLSQAQRDALVADHGYFGRLILTFGKPDSDPDRLQLVQGGDRVLAVFSLYGAVLLVAGVGGIAALIVFIVRALSGKVRPTFEPPVPGGSVYLETVAIFTSAFLLLQTVASLLSLELGTRLMCQILLVPIALWPMARGVPFSTLRRQIGWHTGRGFWREVGTGIFALFAALPLVALAFAAMAALTMYQMRHSGTVPRNPVQQIVSQSSPAILVALFLLATLWAPLVEETMFRGALYRHLRGRLGVLFSTAITAGVFGFMHGYSLPMILPVATLGVVFALMREWRGSLIVSMVAHFIFNATQLTLGILMNQAMK